MNEFANTSNSSALLKNDYSPAEDAMKTALKRRKAKLIEEGSVPVQDEYNSKDVNDNG